MVGEANSGTFIEWRKRNYFLVVFVVTNWIIRQSKGFLRSPLFSLKVRLWLIKVLTGHLFCALKRNGPRKVVQYQPSFSHPYNVLIMMVRHHGVYDLPGHYWFHFLKCTALVLPERTNGFTFKLVGSREKTQYFSPSCKCSNL